MKTIFVDYENDSDEFWEAAYAAESIPEGLDAILYKGDLVTVSDELADAILQWAAQQPGWNGGPEYAPHPLLIQDANQKGDPT